MTAPFTATALGRVFREESDRVPDEPALPERLRSVLDGLYPVFNEGHTLPRHATSCPRRPALEAILQCWLLSDLT